MRDGIQGELLAQRPEEDRQLHWPLPRSSSSSDIRPLLQRRKDVPQPGICSTFSYESPLFPVTRSLGTTHNRQNGNIPCMDIRYIRSRGWEAKSNAAESATVLDRRSTQQGIAALGAECAASRRTSLSRRICDGMATGG